MGIFSSSGGKGELVALLDIGSASVGGALVYLRKAGVPQIIFTVREPIEAGVEFNFNNFLSATLKSIDVVAAKLSNAKVGSPKRLFFVLSSPWYGSQTRVIRFFNNDSFVFTNKFADELIEKEVDIFKAENAEKYADFHGRMLPVELKNMKMILNGYPTANPINQKAQELEMTIFVSMSSEEFMTKVQEMTVRHFHREDIKFSSFAFVSFAVTRDFLAKHQNFLLVDIGGEVTEVSMVKQDVLAASVSFPLGVNSISRNLAKTMDCSNLEARSLMNLIKEGHASSSVQQKVGPILDKIRQNWLAGFENALANLSHDISVPSHMFVTVDSEFFEFFEKIIKTEQFSQYTLAESKFELSFLGAEALHGAVDFAKDVRRDSFLTLESIYINRFLG